jgi:DNA-binding NtrC family response regulator
MKSILLVDDDTEFTHVFCRIVDYLGHHCDVAQSVGEAKEWLATNQFDHIFLDFMLPDGSGIHVFKYLQEQGKRPRVTFITGNPDVKQMINEFVGPQVDYLLKPLQREDIEQKLLNKKAQIPTTSETLTTKSSRPSTSSNSNKDMHFGCLIGESQVMKDMYTMIDRVATSSANVMLMGESGVGKELVAQAIHNASSPEGDLISTNCGGLSKELIGSELFGHEKGAFTGAVGQKIGVFERAHKGTLFLDEVTEMPIDMQPNLLRVLETNTLQRVGGGKDIAINCRVVSATNRNMHSIANDNVLREDIYFRLAVFPIEIPALRERASDIPLLAQAFLSQLNQEHNRSYSIKHDDMKRLIEYQWPGNVRELRHAIHRAFIMSDPDGRYVSLPRNFKSPFATSQETKDTAIQPGKTIEDVEKALIYATLDKVDGNKSAAAQMLGISTKTLYNRLHAYGDMEA